MAKTRLDQLKPGMAVAGARGRRVIEKLDRVHTSVSGVEVYIWRASRASPKDAPFIAGRGDISIEVLNG